MSAELRPFADPVRAPGHSVIVGERLFPAVGRRGQHAPLVADLHGSSADHVVAQELPAAAGEAALHRLVEHPREADRRPPDPPEPGLGVEQPQGEPFERRAGRWQRLRRERVDVAEPAQDRLGLPDGLELDPLVGRGSSVSTTLRLKDRRRPNRKSKSCRPSSLACARAMSNPFRLVAVSRRARSDPAPVPDDRERREHRGDRHHPDHGVRSAAWPRARRASAPGPRRSPT